ncbi:hypothetical protein M404DRAFT_613161 [Pisolithus tinctorius Marx 270]|uniref:Uncharacterized protein n=1 Tax=Pisolithus tinctorius Marx 270 TaxID=870435 RepID=A0A0C3P7M3_PISTI|nr:hypothetical protein M404DRAFT_613161 [Pisolithus tinctorius Marx 270]
MQGSTRQQGIIHTLLGVQSRRVFFHVLRVLREGHRCFSGQLIYSADTWNRHFRLVHVFCALFGLRELIKNMRQEDLPGPPLIAHYGHPPCSCSYGMYVGRLTQPSTTTPVKADELCR